MALIDNWKPITHPYTEKTDAKIKIPTAHSNRMPGIASYPQGPGAVTLVTMY